MTRSLCVFASLRDIMGVPARRNAIDILLPKLISAEVCVFEAEELVEVAS